jgi:hypothetical protein
MNAKTPGTCTNPSCRRLATLTFRGKAYCWYCARALDVLGALPDLAYRQTPKSGQTVSPFPGAA